MVLAAIQFAEPIILGMIVNSLVDSSSAYGTQGFQLKINLLIAWLLISILIVILNASLTIKSDVLSHTLRLNAITDFFSSAIGETSNKENSFHSGRLVKIMLQGVDSLYTFSISFFRGHIEVGVTLIVLLPFTLLLNLNLGFALILLVAIFVFITVKTVVKTENLQNNIEELIKKLDIIAKSFNTVECNIEWNSNPNAWFFVNFFPTKHYINESHKKNGKHVMPITSTKELYLIHEPFIRIFSNSKTGCKITKIAKTHNFAMSKVIGKHFNFGNHLIRKSTFGKKLNLNLNLINYDIKYLLK